MNRYALMEKPILASIGTVLLALGLAITLFGNAFHLVSNHIHAYFNVKMSMHSASYEILKTILILFIFTPLVIMIFRGSNPARKIYLLLFVISLIYWLFHIGAIAANQANFSLLRGICLLLELIGLICLFTPDSNHWFRAK